jgi:hypothetical protein
LRQGGDGASDALGRLRAGEVEMLGELHDAFGAYESGALFIRGLCEPVWPAEIHRL